MFIAGEWIDATSGRTFPITNPANGDEIGTMPDGGAADATAAIDAAADAFDGWAATTAFERADILMRAWQLMNDRAEELARLMTTEQGKPLKAATFEAGYAADFIRWRSPPGGRGYSAMESCGCSWRRSSGAPRPTGTCSSCSPASCGRTLGTG